MSGPSTSANPRPEDAEKDQPPADDNAVMRAVIRKIMAEERALLQVANRPGEQAENQEG